MGFTSEKVTFRTQPVGTKEERSPATTSTMSWPSRPAGNFTKLPEPGAKMILTPKAYYATHDTMPPPNQVIVMASAHILMRDQYQAADRKATGKRSTDQSVTNARPSKQIRL